MKTKDITKSNNPNYRHGLSHTPEYRVWADIKARCLNTSSKLFKYYGSRGITMCKNWAKSFPKFIKDVGHRPSPNHQIDRIDNLKGYHPNNCRWVLRKSNIRNRRVTKKVMFRGKKIPLAELCEIYEKDYQFVLNRLGRGYPIEDALFAPKNSIYRYKAHD